HFHLGELRAIGVVVIVVVLVHRLILLPSSCMDASISKGAGAFALFDPREGVRRQIPVYTYRPSSFTPESPVVVVMHGRNRNGADYRDSWIAEAERRGSLVVAPEFSELQYPHPLEYN